MTIQKNYFDVYAVSGGSYPRIGSAAGSELRKAWNLHAQKRASREEVQAAEQSVAEEIIREQVASGLDIITDGLVRWYCPISHIAGRMDGVSVGALHHFRDTNYHVRKAVVESVPEWKVPLVANELRFARGVTEKLLKAVLTGPATFFHYAENKTGKSRWEVVDAYVGAICREIMLLAEAEGIAIIQIDDPWLLNWPNEWTYFSHCYAMLYETLQKANGGILLEVKTYGSTCAHMLSNLFDLHCDYLGIDCVADKQAILRILQNPALLRKSGVGLALGIVDARNCIMEDPFMLERIVEPLLLYTELPLLLEPSCGLEFLPRRFAREKCKILAETKHLLVNSALYRDSVKASERQKGVRE